MNKKRFLLISLLLMLLLSPVFSIGFGYHIFEIRTTPDFGKGIVPSSLKYQFNFPVPDIVPDCKSVFAFRLDNGLEYRQLRQSPDTGALYARNPEFLASDGFSPDFDRTYSVQFDEFNLLVSQGVLHTAFADEDMLTAQASIDGRFEYAYENLTWLYDKDHLEGVFNSAVGTPRFSSSTSWTGAPELAGERSVFQLSLSVDLEFNLLRDLITRKDGIKFTTSLRFNPLWLQLFGDTSANFISINNRLTAAATLFSIRQKGMEDTTWFSMVLQNDLTFRHLSGSRIPSYIQEGYIWGTQMPNTANVFTDRLSLTIFGPQLGAPDLYPSLSGFLDIGYSSGDLLNASAFTNIQEFAGSMGFNLKFIVFNVIHFYYEYGYVFNPVFTEEKYSKQSIGFSVGI